MTIFIRMQFKTKLELKYILIFIRNYLSWFCTCNDLRFSIIFYYSRGVYKTHKSLKRDAAIATR